MKHSNKVSKPLLIPSEFLELEQRSRLRGITEGSLAAAAPKCHAHHNQTCGDVIKSAYHRCGIWNEVYRRKNPHQGDEARYGQLWHNCDSREYIWCRITDSIFYHEQTTRCTMHELAKAILAN